MKRSVLRPTVTARWLAVGVAGCLAGCAGDGLVAPPGSQFVVGVAQTGFYKYGPAQTFGADFNLVQGQRVTMLKREFGYSHIQLANNQIGYAATEDLQPAPPSTPPPRTITATPPPRFAAGATKPGRRGSRPSPRGPRPTSVPGDPLFDLNDVPAPPLPTHDPGAPPKPAPSFRF